MKLEKIGYFDIKDEGLLKSANEKIEELGIDMPSIVEQYDNVNAEIVYDPSDNTVFDIKMFDPLHRAGNYYTYGDGWTNWLCEWVDPMGNDTDTVFDEYDGVPQGV